MKLVLILTILSAFVFPTQAKPLKVFILAGQSNMEGPARIETFDYIGDDPATGPLLKQMRGASNAGYHYLGCAKTFALMGQAFAEANLKMLKSRRP